MDVPTFPKSGDSDVYTYDQNAGRIASYAFNINSKSMSGSLQRNQNGSIRQLAITDTFNSGGTQTCNFGTSTTAGYDDLGRLASANCGSVWSQSYTYDPFGNITKSGSIAWMPGYNQSTNQYTLSRTSYDANGHLLTDTFHNYSWDSYGQVSAIDSTTCGTNGTCLTHDAFGRTVEKNVSGTFTEIEYSPLGKACQMNGATQVQCYVPLPGGEILSPGPDTFWHTDWLGSARVGSSVSNRSITFDRGFAPFGETYDTVIGGSTTPEFAGMTQDTISGEYDTPAREYHPTQARWLSPDPAGMTAANPVDPQSWNRYAYVENNPLTFTDPSGLLADQPPVDVCGGDPACSHDPLDCNPIDIFCAPDPEGGPFSLTPNLPIPRSSFGILPGEPSVNIPLGSGNVFTDIWQDALGLPTVPCGAQFGPWCDPSKLPNPWILDGQEITPPKVLRPADPIICTSLYQDLTQEIQDIGARAESIDDFTFVGAFGACAESQGIGCILGALGGGGVSMWNNIDANESEKKAVREKLQQMINARCFTDLQPGDPVPGGL
jgi:RHS repeat-associated protein